MSTRPTIPCSNCSRELVIRADQIGHRVACKFCEYVFRIPTHVTIPCPVCRVEGRARTETLGQTVRCQDCGHGFLAVISALPGARRSQDAPPPPSAELEAIRAELAVITRQRDEAQAQLLALDMRSDNLESERDQLRDELAAAFEKIAASRERAAAVGPLEAELTELRAERDELRDLLAGARDELTAARQHAIAVGSVEAELAELRAERDGLRDLATEAIERAGWQAERIQSLTRALETAREEIGRLKDQNRSTIEELKDLRYRAGKQESLEVERDALAAEVGSLRQQRDQAHARLDVVAGEVDLAVNEARARWDAERGVIRAEAQRDRPASPSFDADLLRLTAERDAALKRVRDLETETFPGLPQTASPQVAVLQKQLEALKDERNELVLRLGAAEADREALLFAQTDRRLIARSDAFDRFGPQGDPELAEALAKLEAETQKVESLEADLKAAQKKIDELSQESESTEFGTEDPRSRMGKPEEKTPSTIMPRKQEAG